jgi:DNA-binding beta-propeller fold protein YncE
MQSAWIFSFILNVAPTPLAVTGKKIVLPGGPEFVGMDYLAYDVAHHRVWVPAGNTGSVDVIASDGTLTRVAGFPTMELEIHGQKRTVGPSSATVGEGVVFIGNRADATICAVDAATLVRRGCVKLASPPDGLAYVRATHEVWATTPRSQSLTIIDASRPDSLVIAGEVALSGTPEGYGVDVGAQLFITNLEDKNSTLLIDLFTRKITRVLHPFCNDEGPRGLAVADDPKMIVVACSDHLVALDPLNDKVLSTLATGAGLDNIDYASHLVYAAGGKDARLTVAKIGVGGKLDVAWLATTTPGARVVVADDNGNAYVADSKQGAIWVFNPHFASH